MKIKRMFAGWLAWCILLGAAAQENQNYMDMPLEALLSMEVTSAGKKAQRIQDIPASVVVITRSEIEQHGFATLNQILMHVTGLYGVDQRAVDGVIFGVRGFWSAVANNLIILVNGVRQERVPTDGAVYVSVRVPPTAIDRIEVIRGPMSVNYGTGAFFGVINIITDEIRSDKNHQITASVGNQNTAETSVRAAFEHDQLKLVFNGGYRDFGGPDEPYTRMSTQDLGALYGVIPDTTDGRYTESDTFFNISARYKGFRAHVNFDHVSMRGDIFFPAADEGFQGRRSYTTLAVGYEKAWSDTFTLDGMVTYHKGSVRTEWDWFTPPEELNFGGDINYTEDMALDVTAFYKPSDKLEVTGGLYYKKIIDENLMTEVPHIEFIYKLGITEPAISQAVYGQMDWRPTEKLQFVAGLRADQAEAYGTFYRIFAEGESTQLGAYTHDDVEVLPRLAAIYKSSESNVFKFLYGKAINHPLTPANATQAYLAGSPLEPEFITTLEAVHSWVPSTRFSTNLSVFYNELDKLIINEIETVDGAFFGNNRNAGMMETSGVELAVKAVPAKGWLIDFSFTAQKSDDKSEAYGAFDVAYSPEFLGYLKTSLMVGRRTNVGLTARYVDKMKSLYDLTIPGRISEDTDGYFSLGASFRMSDIKGSGYYVELSGSNLTNESYLHPTTQLQATWADKGLIGDSAHIQLTVGKKM